MRPARDAVESRFWRADEAGAAAAARGARLGVRCGMRGRLGLSSGRWRPSTSWGSSRRMDRACCVGVRDGVRRAAVRRRHARRTTSVRRRPRHTEIKFFRSTAFGAWTAGSVLVPRKLLLDLRETRSGGAAGQQQRQLAGQPARRPTSPKMTCSQMVDATAKTDAAAQQMSMTTSRSHGPPNE